LAYTIKNIYDVELYNNNNRLIYITIPEKSLKNKLIQRFVFSELNSNFKYISFPVDGMMFYFFFNEEKTSTIQAIFSLNEFFKKEYQLDFKFFL
jgi:hypothetical protein